MKASAILKVLNPILAVLVLNQAITGIFSGVMPRPVFEAIHQAGGIAMAAAATLHLTLNWSWVRANFLRKRPPVQPI